MRLQMSSFFIVPMCKRAASLAVRLCLHCSTELTVRVVTISVLSHDP